MKNARFGLSSDTQLRLLNTVVGTLTETQERLSGDRVLGDWSGYFRVTTDDEHPLFSVTWGLPSRDNYLPHDRLMRVPAREARLHVGGYTLITDVFPRGHNDSVLAAIAVAMGWLTVPEIAPAETTSE